MLGPLAGGLIVGYLHWRVIFFVNMPIGLVGLYLVCRFLPDYRARARDPLDCRRARPLRLRHRAPLVRARDLRRAHARHGEIVGLLALSRRCSSSAYVRHALRAAHPLLGSRSSGSARSAPRSIGSFITRLGAGGMPFLLAAPLPGRPRLLAGPVGAAAHAAVDRRDALKVFMPRSSPGSAIAACSSRTPSSSAGSSRSSRRRQYRCFTRQLRRTSRP